LTKLRSVCIHLRPSRVHDVEDTPAHCH